jgi:hypothetical protein
MAIMLLCVRRRQRFDNTLFFLLVSLIDATQNLFETDKSQLSPTHLR